jgi:membrane dipeptidase
MRRAPAVVAFWMGLAACRGAAQDPMPASTAAAGPSSATNTPAAPVPSAAPPPPSTPTVNPTDHKARAEELARRLIILDGHIDVPYRLEKGRDQRGMLTEDISERTKAGDFDYPRARAGGLDVVFMSIYVPPKYEQGGARKYAHGLIELVESFAKKWPDKFALARSPAEARKNAAAGTISLALGMVNGSPIEHQLENVAHFQRLGVRYITLALS